MNEMENSFHKAVNEVGQNDGACYFRFVPIDKYLFETLINSQLYFSRAKDLNDPFDCQINIEETVEQALKSVKDENIKPGGILHALRRDKSIIQQWQNGTKTIGIRCFSLVDPGCMESTLMWTHYADNHSGVCLKYKFPSCFLEKYGPLENVDYSDEDLITKFLIKNNDGPTQSKKPMQDFWRILLITKHSSWSYENEARLIIEFEDKCDKKQKEEIEQGGLHVVPENGLLDFPRRSLEAIYFGLNASEGVKYAISGLIDKLKLDFNSNIKLYYIKRAGDRNFGIHAKCWPPKG